MVRVITQLTAMSKPFHQTDAWKKASKAHKQLICCDCGSSTDIQSGHILAASRYPMMRLWKSNLILQCKLCNLKLGTDIHWSIQAVKLLVIYWMIKILTYLVIFLIFVSAVGIAGRYWWLDTENNASTITDHIKADIIDYWNETERKL